MLKKILITVILIGVLGYLSYYAYYYINWYYIIEKHSEETTYDPAQSSVEEYYHESSPKVAAPKLEFEDNFQYENFKNPPLLYRPWTRWSWPGNDVDDEEIARQLRQLYDYGFGGVEIQAFASGLKHDLDSVTRRRLFSTDTESFFSHIRWAIDQADSLGLLVDLTVGSGWPTGGSQIAIDDNIKTLVYGEKIMSGNTQISIEIPPPEKPFLYYFLGLVQELTKEDMADYIPDAAVLVDLVATEVLEDNRSLIPYNLSDQITLSASNIYILTDSINDGKLVWQAPAGKWNIIAIYSLPNGEKPSLSTNPTRGLVLDHFDSIKVVSNYNYLFGKRSRIAEKAGKGLHGIFNDSYEFKGDRHFSSDFMQQFESLRGYDLTPWLPAVLTPVHDSFFFDIWQIKSRSAFKFPELNSRINYDYSQTVSDLFISNYIDVSNKWANENGLVSRTQPYGIKIDVIKAAGHADIPETEALYAGEAAMFLKMISSGAHLYNRPLTGAESFAHIRKEYMDTPMKVKIETDKLFINGVNHILYNSTPYVYDEEGYGPLGWNPHSSPYSAFGFSSFANEKAPFWQYQTTINQYISRMQYMLRQGKPKADVLVYYPFYGFSSSFKYVNDHKELLFNGDAPSGEPSIPQLNPLKLFFGEYLEFEESEQVLWLKNIWPVLENLESQGYTWDWVNDDALQQAVASNDKIRIKDNNYNGLLLYDINSIQLTTAERISQLSTAGVGIATIGDLPIGQPGFYNYKVNDQRVVDLMKIVSSSPAYLKLNEGNENSIFNFYKSVSYKSRNKQIRHSLRKGNGWELLFLSNTSSDNVNLSIEPLDHFDYAYNMNAETGEIYSLAESEYLNLHFGSFDSKLIYFSNTQISKSLILPKKARVDSLHISDWAFKASINKKDTLVQNFKLEDWRSIDYLKYHAGKAILTATFDINEKQGLHYTLDLGNVYGAVDVEINTINVGPILWPPFELDVSRFIKQGRNVIKLTVTPPIRNGLIGRALAGDSELLQFANKGNTLMASGLVGPVKLRIESE